MHTFRDAYRALIAQPAVSAGIILSLALAIGANTAIFGLADEILWKPLPVRAPDRLVTLHGVDTTTGSYVPISYRDYLDYRDGAGAFSALAAFVRVPVVVQAGGPAGHDPAGRDQAGRGGAAGHGPAGHGPAERVAAELVSANYFEAVGIDPIAGRAITRDDEARELPVALVSERLWRRQQAVAPIAVGQSIVVHGTPFTVIGVLPARYKGTLLDWVDPPDVWLPIVHFERVLPAARGSRLLTAREMRGMALVGRLRDGVAIGEAQAAVKTIASRLAASFPASNRQLTVTLIPSNQSNFWPGHRPTVTRSLAAFGGAVALVLLLACTNIANLLLERASARRKEIAIRLALGSTRASLIRQLMTESVLLSAIGAVVGLAFARVLSATLASAAQPLGVRLAVDLTLDRRALVFTVVVSLVTAVLFGLAPAMRASRVSLVAALKGTTRTLDLGFRLISLRHLLVVAQVAMSLVLLVCGSLFARSVMQTWRTDPGFAIDGLLVMHVDLIGREDTDGRNRRLIQQAADRIETMPGVSAVTVSSETPFSRARVPMRIAADDGSADARPPIAIESTLVGSHYFETLGIRLLGGRTIEARDVDASAKVVVINETLARQLWGTTAAVGRHVRRVLPNGTSDRWEVIGVAQTVKHHQMTEAPIGMVYRPIFDGRTAGATLLLRTATPARTIAPALRDVISSLDATVVSPAIGDVREQVARSIEPQRVAAALIGLFSVTALVLASVGLYSVLTFTVAQRTREIGIRIALGAEPRQLLRAVVSRGLLLASIGLVVGLGLAALVTPLLATLVPGVTSMDPIAFGSVSMGLLAVACLASVRPARRAARVNPLIALKVE